MPRKYQPKTDRKNGHRKPTSVPAKFKPGFLSTLDRRTDLAKALRANRDAIVRDVGGQEDVGHVKNALVERFCWLECVLQTIEQEMAGGNVDRLGVWIQATNSLSGLAKVLGIEPKQRTVDLKTYLVNGSNGTSSPTNGQATGAAT
jgi:hypothetical protein